MPKARVNPIAFLVVAITFGLLGMLITLIFVAPAKGSESAVFNGSQGLLTLLGIIVGYYFGASKSDAEVNPHGGKPPKEGE
jgi:uncharacterized membrane protein